MTAPLFRRQQSRCHIFNVMVFPVPVSFTTHKISVSRSCTWNVTPSDWSLVDPHPHVLQTFDCRFETPPPLLFGVLMKLGRLLYRQIRCASERKRPGHFDVRLFAISDFNRRVREISSKTASATISATDPTTAADVVARPHALRAPRTSVLVNKPIVAQNEAEHNRLRKTFA